MHRQLVYLEMVQEPQNDLVSRISEAPWLPRCFIKEAPLPLLSLRALYHIRREPPEDIEKEEGDAMGRLMDGS